MDDTRISQLTFGEPLEGDEYIPIVQYSHTISALEAVYTTPSALAEYIIGEAAFYPVGAIIPYAGVLSAKDIPRGWLLCDGSEVSIDDYPNLYNCIVNTYGDTLSGVFALPNLKGRVIVGYDDTSDFTNFNAVEPSWPRTQDVVIGSTGGEFYHKLTAKDIPCTTTAVSIPSATNTIPSIIYQTITLNFSLRAKIWFTLTGDTLNIKYNEDLSKVSVTTITYKTFYNDGVIINQGTYTTPSKVGTFQLPFTVIAASDANLHTVGLSPTYSRIETSPSKSNNYTTIIHTHDPVSNVHAYKHTLNMSGIVADQPAVYFLSNDPTKKQPITIPLAPKEVEIYNRSVPTRGGKDRISWTDTLNLRSYGNNLPSTLDLTFYFHQCIVQVTDAGTWVTVGVTGDGRYLTVRKSVRPDSNGIVQVKILDRKWGGHGLKVYALVPQYEVKQPDVIQTPSAYYATVAIPSDSVSDVNVTQPYMLMNYIIKH
jgi:microcystin-dependent protein